MPSAVHALLLGAVLLVPAAAAGTTVDVTVGFGGVHRTAAWTPIVVTVPAEAGDGWRVWVEDPDGQWVRSPAAIETTGDGARRLRFRARFGRLEGAVRVEGPDAAGASRLTLAPVPPAIAGDEPTFLVIGTFEAAERAARFIGREGDARPRVIHVAGPSDLTAGAQGMSARDFDGIDMIIVCGTAVVDADDDLSRDALAAIDGWVCGGGRLVFVAGESAQRAAREGSIPSRWLPGRTGASGRIERLVPLRRSAALETFARASRPLDKAALAALQVPVLADPGRLDGTVLFFEGREAADLPLAVRSVRGFGTVTWLGLDIDRPAFRSWPGTDTLMVELLGGRAATSAGRVGEAGARDLDLAGQLRTAIDYYPGVAPVPFELIAGLGLLYVACLYPLDWWLTARGGRPGLAWVSLPVLVALFGGVAWGTARRWKGDEWRETVAGVVDTDVVGGWSRGRSWAGVWSPVNATLTVTAAPDAAAAPAAGTDVAVSWCASTGRGLGGTDAPTPHPGLGAEDYSADASSTLAGVTIAADASRLFEADWSGRSDRVAGSAPIVSTLDRDAQAALRGAIESRLPFPLEACVLVHAGWLYDVGVLVPGGRFEPAAGRGPRSLAGALTRRAAAKERDVAERWDVASTDVARILEIAGFHRAAGGSSYTAIEAGRLACLDLSPVLDTGRAVLVGRGPPGMGWQVRSASAEAPSPPMSEFAAQTFLWRFVLPLEPSKP